MCSVKVDPPLSSCFNMQFGSYGMITQQYASRSRRHVVLRCDPAKFQNDDTSPVCGMLSGCVIPAGGLLALACWTGVR